MINKKTEERIRIDGPSKNKKKDPNCKHKWERLGSASWYCSKCNAQVNLGCEHNGCAYSVACSACVEEIIKENQPWEKYLAEHSW